MPSFACCLYCVYNKASAELRAQLLHQAHKTIYGHWLCQLLSNIAVVILFLRKNQDH